ncbi:hypothetical protein AAFF_G00026210 [Aldrovandia affinis]|uniref:Uncharacterized protein n=1 Tax=Aldrovandia affinis TaxID=143900 RepID=A0AAD7VXT8_9TELE|nr:hypothetical protein AAFF_G00026210 [Aldrovandia affinis]
MEGIKLLGVTFQNDGGGNWSWEEALRHNRLLPKSSLTTERVLYGPHEGCRTPELQRQWRIINTVKQVLWEGWGMEPTEDP